MDKETLSNYGWIVICVLVLAVMLALATPFGSFIADGFKATYTGLFDTGDSALDTALGAVGVDTNQGPQITFNEEWSSDEYYPTIVTNTTTVLSGTVVGQNTINSLTINGASVNVNLDGTWESEIETKIGDIVEVTVTARDEKGKETTETVYVGNVEIRDIVIDYTDQTHFGYYGDVADYTIPVMYKYWGVQNLWYRIVALGTEAFRYQSGLNSITLHEGITSIGNRAFTNCTNLKTIYIPDSVTSIGYEAFYQCYSLEEIDLPDNITIIKNDTFAYCKSLTKFIVPSKVEEIGGDAFEQCEKLTELYIPVSVKKIGNFIISGCDSLTDIYYAGTIEEWNKIDLGTYWDHYSPEFVIHCSDGDIAK